MRLGVIERGSTWFLYGEESSLYLSALCSHSAVDYEFEIELNDSERESYKSQGKIYLDKLAYEIHYSAPGVRESKSIYRERGLTKSDREKLNAAYLKWRESNS